MENPFKSKLRLVRGTRFTSFLFIATSMAIAAGILWAANMYYNIDTGEVVIEEIKRISGVLRATGGAIVGGTPTQNPDTGYVFQVVGSSKLATTTVASGYLGFTGSDTYVGLTAPDSYGTTTAKVYKLPQHGNYPPQIDYVLTWQAGDQLMWKEVSGVTGAGDVTAVGNCPSGECFTETGTAGTALWFYDAQGRGKLTIADLTAPRTYTLPDVSGTIALGTGTPNYVAYWTDTNTLAGEQYLAPTRGGTGVDSSVWNGMVRVVGGSWGPVTGSPGYAAYWSDANTVAAEQFLATSRGGLGANVTAAGAGELLYSTAATTYGRLAAGSSGQILTSGGAAAPSWQNIADLITATNGLTESGTTVLTLKLGGTLTENTTIAQGAYDMIFNLTDTGDFKVQDAGTDLFTVTDDGKILFKTYPLAETNKEILVGIIPILGFDLPVQTATTSFVKISRTVDRCDFPPTPSGATRIYKFVIRYTDDLPTASTTDWQVATSTGVAYSSFTLEGSDNSALDSGQTRIKAASVPCDTYPWWLEVKIPSAQAGKKIRIFQIFLAAYDQLQ